MATGDIATGSGGVKTVQDLYDLINGTSKTDSGGTKTTQTSEGISQESMNAMLQNALSGTNGLAAISQGQRTAGGYGSATNQMLTNDLLTRTAAQIAASNKTATQTVTQSPTTQTTGGITAGGVAKSAGFLAALQQLADTGTSAKKFSNLLGMGSSTPDVGTSAIDAMAPMTNANAAMPIAQQYGSQNISTPVAQTLDPVDTSSFVQTPAPVTPVEDIPAPVAPMNETPGKTFDDTDLQLYADGGMVSASGMTRTQPLYSTGSKMNPIRLADGGSVSKKGLGILGTSQYNSVIDPRESLAGTVGAGGNAVDSSGNPVGQVIDPTTNTSVAQPGSGGSSGRDDGNGGITSGDSPTSNPGPLGTSINNIISGDATNRDYGTLSKGVGLLGTLTGNRDLATAGQIGGIASSDSLTGAGLTVANIATKGAIGEVSNIVKTIKDPTLGNVVDTAASFNPLTAVSNRILALAGLGSLGDIAGNVADMVSPNNPMSADQQNAATTAYADNQKAIAAADAQAKQDAIDAANAQAAAATPPTNALVNAVNSAATNGSSASHAVSVGEPGSAMGYNNSSVNSISTPGATQTTTAADGGEMTGPGTGVSDSIHAMLSDGEYVLSADTVKAIGVDKLDALQQKYHTPAAVQKLKSFAR